MRKIGISGSSAPAPAQPSKRAGRIAAKKLVNVTVKAVETGTVKASLAAGADGVKVSLVPQHEVVVTATAAPPSAFARVKLAGAYAAKSMRQAGAGLAQGVHKLGTALLGGLRALGGAIGKLFGKSAPAAEVTSGSEESTPFYSASDELLAQD